MHTSPESHAYRGTFDSEAAPGMTRKGGVIFALGLAIQDWAQQISVTERHNPKR